MYFSAFRRMAMESKSFCSKSNPGCSVLFATASACSKIRAMTVLLPLLIVLALPKTAV